MLERWLNHETMAIHERVKNWREAVELSAEPLLNNGTIEHSYLAAIYQQHQLLGPYYVLAPGIAMPHARPEQGANKLGLSLLVVKEGVNFASSDNDPVYLIIMLAAPDGNQHIEMISQLAELFSNEEDVAKIVASDQIDQIQKVISKY